LRENDLRSRQFPRLKEDASLEFYSQRRAPNHLSLPAMERGGEWEATTRQVPRNEPVGRNSIDLARRHRLPWAHLWGSEAFSGDAGGLNKISPSDDSKRSQARFLGSARLDANR